MIIYSKNNYKKLYLSQYTSYFQIGQNEYVFSNSLFCSSVKIKTTEKKIDLFLVEMKNGINLDDFITLIKDLKFGNKNFAYTLMKSGVVE